MDQVLIDRFMKFVYPEPNTGCWLWGGSSDKDGYGNFQMNGKPIRAHRFSFIHFKSDIGGLWVLHKCDVPGCVNPDHLFLGTGKDNSVDMDAKNRRRPLVGEKHQFSTITDAQALEIKIKHSEGLLTHNQIASMFNVTRSIVSQIARGFTYSHVPGINDVPIRKNRYIKTHRSSNAKFSDDQVRSIREEYKLGGSPREIAKRHNVYDSTIFDMVKGRTYFNIK